MSSANVAALLEGSVLNRTGRINHGTDGANNFMNSGGQLLGHEHFASEVETHLHHTEQPIALQESWHCPT